ncbi:MAG: hypothetical protein H6708_19520 [Kofleriaceae bacterium]|nr:hypothetical protein [Myxococcales bacterium]MCB9562598.1 hypothetical protein [Kofleriaceae bacterium]
MQWDQARAHLRESFAVVRDTETSMVVRLVLRVGDQDVPQHVGLSPATVHGQAWLAIVADLFAEPRLSPRGAITCQDHMAFGALVSRHGAYLLRHGVLLDDLSAGALDWNIAATAQEAVRMRVNLKAPPSEPLAFYAE